MSDYELFLTEQTSILFIDSIQSKCYVVSMEEFESLQTTNAYFSRYEEFDVVERSTTRRRSSWTLR